MNDIPFVAAHEKIVQSGDLIEQYEYEKLPIPPTIHRRGKRKSNHFKFKSERHIKRAVFNFRRRTRANLVYGAPHMFTLTMGEIVDISTANKLFTQFGVRMKSEFGDVIWIAVPEFQERGAVHFHVLIWRLPHDTHLTERNTRRIQHLWGYGYVDIIATDGSPKLSGYLAKYMSKAMYDDRLFGKKAYSCSRNALSPVSLNTKTSVTLFKEEFNIDSQTNARVPIKERNYEAKWVGRVRYRAYDNTIDKKPQ